MPFEKSADSDTCVMIYCQVKLPKEKVFSGLFMHHTKPVGWLLKKMTGCYALFRIFRNNAVMKKQFVRRASKVQIMIS